MGSTFLGDQPSGANVRTVQTLASVASNGANAIAGSIGAGIFRAPQALQLDSAWFEPTGADSAAANASSYRQLTVINAGQDGTGTTVLASLNLVASQGSNTTRALSLAATPTVAAGAIVAIQHATVGGAHSAGTVLVACNYHSNFRPI